MERADGHVQVRNADVVLETIDEDGERQWMGKCQVSTSPDSIRINCIRGDWPGDGSHQEAGQPVVNTAGNGIPGSVWRIEGDTILETLRDNAFLPCADINLLNNYIHSEKIIITFE